MFKIDAIAFKLSSLVIMCGGEFLHEADAIAETYHPCGLNMSIGVN